MTSLETAPSLDEVEISLFGPGTGEALALHMGCGDWIVVDSCIHRDSRENAILKYFRTLEVRDPQVRLIVPTHAHDDHIGGISAIVREFPNALVAPPVATTSEEFFALLEQDVHFDELRQSVYREFHSLFVILEERRTAQSTAYGYRWAIEDRPLWSRPATDATPAARITALSPSDTAVLECQRGFARSFAMVGGAPRVPQQDPNALAVALWVEVGDIKVLLGSDLEKGPGQGCGWNRVLASGPPDRGKASVYKVAHHGDPEADHPRVWTDMLLERPTAVIAPKRSSHRPRREDIARLRGRTDSLYITASPGFRLGSDEARTAAATIGDIAEQVWETDQRAGQVRLRSTWDNPNGWVVDLVDPARAL